MQILGECLRSYCGGPGAIRSPGAIASNMLICLGNLSSSFHMPWIVALRIGVVSRLEMMQLPS